MPGRLKLTFAGLLGTGVLAACTAAERLPASGPDRQAPGFFPVAPASEQGTLIANLYPIVFWIAVGVFVLVEGLLLLIVFRFRRRPSDDSLPPQTHGNNVLEVLWTLIPALIVTGLFALTVDRLTDIERLDDSPAVTIDVKGFQWQWTFSYPDEGITLTGAGTEGPVMGIPVNETVRIRLTAEDVIHSFYVPQFLYKKDVIPGRVNEFDVMLHQAGTYHGQCAEFCGLQHYTMLFTVEAMDRPAYDAWVADQKGPAGGVSPPPGAETITLTAVDANTFDPPDLQAPADKPIVFDFRNADPAAPHNVAIEGAEEDGGTWSGRPIAEGGQNATYTAPPLAAGTYTFFCEVHPDTMRGTLTVGGP
jgi:cytochrome c oxidase subunit II